MTWLPRKHYLRMVRDRERDRKKFEKQRRNEPESAVTLKVYRRPKGDPSQQYIVKTVDVPSEGRERYR